MKKFFFLTILFVFVIFQKIICSEDINISGSVKNNKNYISGVSISFIDKDDKIFKTLSDEKGFYSINIPKNIYSINIEKDFFRLSDKNLKNYSPQKNTIINLELNSSSSFLDGFVVDKNEKPIKNAKIIIKSGIYSEKIFSDENGKFSTYLKPGIFSLIVSKYGYSDVGFIRKIEKNSSINNEKIKLKSLEFFLKGTVTDGTKSLSDIEVSLHDKFFKKIDFTTTDKDGFFYFYKIPLEENLFLLVNDASYKTYKSEIFKFNKKLNNKIILLNKK